MFNVDLNDLECFVKENLVKKSGVKVVLFYMSTESLMFSKPLVMTTTECHEAMMEKNMQLVSNNQLELMQQDQLRYFRKYLVQNHAANDDLDQGVYLF